MDNMLNLKSKIQNNIPLSPPSKGEVRKLLLWGEKQTSGTVKPSPGRAGGTPNAFPLDLEFGRERGVCGIPIV
jgi:hypothetical protein